MTNPKDRGNDQAFPTIWTEYDENTQKPEWVQADGITVREYCFIKVLAALIASGRMDPTAYGNLAYTATEITNEAMMKL